MGNELIERFAWKDVHAIDPERLRQTARFPRTLTASPEATVDEVLAALDPSHDMIVLRDEDGPVCGLITKAWLAPDALATPLDELLRDAAAQVEKFTPLREAPPLRWCFEGKHHTNACPCSLHPGSPCGE